MRIFAKEKCLRVHEENSDIGVIGFVGFLWLGAREQKLPFHVGRLPALCHLEQLRAQVDGADG